MTLRRWAAVIAAATLSGCGSAATQPSAPSPSVPKLFVVALSAIVYERTTPYTGGDLRVSIGTGKVFQEGKFAARLHRIDATHWNLESSTDQTFVFTVGEDYWIFLLDQSRNTFFQNPDYGDEFSINGTRLTRADRVSDAFLFTSSAVRRFKVVDASGRIE